MKYETTTALYTEQGWEHQQMFLSFSGEKGIVETIRDRLEELAIDDDFHVGIRVRIDDGEVLEVDLVGRDNDHLGRIKAYLLEEIALGHLRAVPKNRIDSQPL